MTETTLPMVLCSLKAMLLLMTAAGVTLALRGGPARMRAVVWATALAGSLLIPMVAPMLPSWTVPISIPSLSETTQPSTSIVSTLTRLIDDDSARSVRSAANSNHESKPIPGRLDLQTPIWICWLAGVAVALWCLAGDLRRMWMVIRNAQPVTDPGWLELLADARDRVGCQRNIRLVASSEVEVPATVGMWRPVIVLPAHADTWIGKRRVAVLFHELIHVARFDWPVRVIARLARAAYWFNPVAWWAVRRLDLEQELACDEEVLSHGTRASSYACHLLAIARAVSKNPLPAISGMAMARRSHLEERIMKMLKRTNHRKVGMGVLIPTAILMAAMVPAIAAVYPGDPPPRPASSELKQIVTEMQQVEKRIEPHLEGIEDLEIAIDHDIEIDVDAIAAIEDKMQPYLDQLEAIELDMEPFHEQMEEFEEKMKTLVLHMEDGTLEEIEGQIQEQIAVHMEMVEAIHVDMEPFHEQMEEIHAQLEPLHEQMEELHIGMEPYHREMEKHHERMEEFQREIEPFHDEMERLGERLEAALETEVAAMLRDHLGAVTTVAADFDEAAARIVEEARVRVDDDMVRIRASGREVREILTDLIKPHMVGLEEAFDAAVDNTADALSPLEISID
jgi:beta-lactamase regulating signal transducer with metallopeptidase domain/predicted  nucleic acid-binding Zn-ribbon protein